MLAMSLKHLTRDTAVDYRKPLATNDRAVITKDDIGLLVALQVSYCLKVANLNFTYGRWHLIAQEIFQYQYLEKLITTGLCNSKDESFRKRWNTAGRGAL